LKLTLDEANDLLSALAGIEDMDDFYQQAHDDIYTAVDDYNTDYNGEDSLKELIAE
jgi:replicative DNA helicase